MSKKATYGEKAKAVNAEKVKYWQEKRQSVGTFQYIAEMCFRSRPVIATAINHGIATESTEKNIDNLYSKKLR
jgi:hypothetical protein